MLLRYAIRQKSAPVIKLHKISLSAKFSSIRFASLINKIYKNLSKTIATTQKTLSLTSVAPLVELNYE